MLVHNILFYAFANKLPKSTLPGGFIYRFLRNYCAGKMLKQCGKNVNVENQCYIGSGKGIKLGDYSGIGANCYLQGDISIGKYVMMAPGVTILTSTHDYSDLSKPMCMQKNSNQLPVSIEDDVWIGTGVIILPGVTIGRGTIIGAGSVVTKSLDPYSIYAGNPAKIIGKRA